MPGPSTAASMANHDQNAASQPSSCTPLPAGTLDELKARLLTSRAANEWAAMKKTKPYSGLEHISAMDEILQIPGLQSVKETFLQAIQYSTSVRPAQMRPWSGSQNITVTGGTSALRDRVIMLFVKLLRQIKRLSDFKPTRCNMDQLLGQLAWNNTVACYIATVRDDFDTPITSFVEYLERTDFDPPLLILSGNREAVSLLLDNSCVLRKHFPFRLNIEDYSEEEMLYAMIERLRECFGEDIQFEGGPTGEITRSFIGQVIRTAHLHPKDSGLDYLEIALRAVCDRVAKRLSHESEPSVREIIENLVNPIPTPFLITRQDFLGETQNLSIKKMSLRSLFADLVGADSLLSTFEGFARSVAATRARGRDPRHSVPFTFVFTGPPGTGKTTAARQIGVIYHDWNLLPSNEVIEVTARDLQASFMGQTAEKTYKLVQKAKGKVLFIDEAYGLMDESQHSYMREARDELVACITKPEFHKQVVIVLAGYEDEMAKMLAANPGLISRLRNKIKFPGLSAPQRLNVLVKSIEKKSGAKVDLGDKDPMIRYDKSIKAAFEHLVASPQWGNGRDIENISEQVVSELFATAPEDSDQQLVVHGEMIMSVLMTWGAIDEDESFE